MPAIEPPQPTFTANSTSKQPAKNISPEGMRFVDGYELLAEIGRGGMGVVYLAEQTRPIRRRVALKLIKLGMDTRQVIARFEAERQALALMEHPNVAKVLGAGASGTGRPYFVMELVRGPRITDYCDQYHLSMRERLELFLQVCRAIQHAHQKGIIHRDIKPSNILVTQQDGSAVPKVIDFGIAKATGGQSLTDKTVFTSVEQFLGTPAYTSPEQAEGSGDVDTRTDIYSLGVLLYELLTGRTPFDSEELLRAGWDSMRRTIRETEPQRPSTRLTTLTREELDGIARHRRVEPPKLIHALRGDLDWIAMKCLEKARTRRYGTSSGIVTDIERHLNHELVVARPPSNLYRFQKLVRRNRLFFSAGVAVFAALVAGLGMATWSLRHEKQARQEALIAEQRSEAREREARASEAEARAALDFFTDSQIARKFPPKAKRPATAVSALSAHAALGWAQRISNQTSPLLLTSSLNAADPGNIISNETSVPALPVVSSGYGATYAQWAGVWWQWSMQLPLTNSAGAIHPDIDSPAFDVTEGQGPEVWFLAAPFGTVKRSCVIPSDKWLFFPLLNAESSSLEQGTVFFGDKADEQAAIARYFQDHVTGLFCEIDGVPVPELNSYRFTNPQITFKAPSPWVFGELGGVGTSTGDGYYILLRPLGPGQHTLRYGGAFQFRKPADVFDLYARLDMTYYLTIP
jgi:serine/threonine protein kinase